MTGRYLPGTDSSTRTACSLAVGLNAIAIPVAASARMTIATTTKVLPTNMIRGRDGRSSTGASARAGAGAVNAATGTCGTDGCGGAEAAGLRPTGSRTIGSRAT